MPSTLPRSSARKGVLHRYGEFLPLTAATPLIDLGEGSTPLVRSRHVGPSLGIPDLYFKLESCNPTGSTSCGRMATRATTRTVTSEGSAAAPAVSAS